MQRSRSQDDGSRAPSSTGGNGHGRGHGSRGHERSGRARLLALLREKDETIQVMRDSKVSEIMRLNEELDWVAGKLLEREAEVEAKNLEIAAKVTEIGMRDGELSERDGVIAHQEEEIRSKDNEIYRLKALVASRDADIGRKAGQIARTMEAEMKLGREAGAKDEGLVCKDGEIARLREQIERKDGEIARRDGHISNLKSALQNCVELVESDESKDAEIARLTEVVVKLGLDVTSKDAEIAAKNRQIDQEFKASERKGREINTLIAKAVRNDEAFAIKAEEVEALKVSKAKLKHALKDSTENAANLAADMGQLMTWKDAEIAGKNDEIAQKNEAIGRKDEEIKTLKAALENFRANIDTVDLTNEEEEPPGKRKRTTEPLSVTLQRESNQRLARVKQEKVEAEAALEDVRDDLEIANDTVSQQALFTDAWQTKFDEVAEVASAHGVDGSVISAIRNRSVV